MKIIILANFPSTLDGTPKGRFTNLAMLLHNRGHEVELITSDFEHGKKHHRTATENKYPFKLTFLHESGYSGNISPKRIISHMVWGHNVGKYLRSLTEKPDVIYSALPTFTAARYAVDYCNWGGQNL